jgi:hypothetical protein
MEYTVLLLKSLDTLRDTLKHNGRVSTYYNTQPFGAAVARPAETKYGRYLGVKNKPEQRC